MSSSRGDCDKAAGEGRKKAVVEEPITMMSIVQCNCSKARYALPVFTLHPLADLGINKWMLEDSLNESKLNFIDTYNFSFLTI